MRLAVLPAALVTLIAAGVVAYLRYGPSGQDAMTDWGVLAGALLLMGAVVVGGGMLAHTVARTTTARYDSARRAVARGQAELRALLLRLEQGEPVRPLRPETSNPPQGDALVLLNHEITTAQRTAERAVLEAAELMRGQVTGSRYQLEMFANVARRLQSLVHREIELLDELENQVEDPELLKGLFQVDHLATRIRRHAENLAVLGGAVSRRQWTTPVDLTDVLRSAVAEVEHYQRIKVVPPVEGRVRGHAVADVIHLLAELAENATVFSSPHTQVLLRAQRVTSGVVIEVEDRGLGMSTAETTRMNALLAEPDRVDVGKLLQDGRIGLYVVSLLSRRHRILVQLQSNIYGGTQAVLVLPPTLLGEENEERENDWHHNPERPRLEVVGSAPASVPAPRTEEAGEPEDDDRPPLPRRVRQTHLAPELREQPAPLFRREVEHDPGLMAAFRRGTVLAEDPEGEPEPTTQSLTEGASDGARHSSQAH
ncbi:ATP-binding protein [Streptomyces sp. NPDC005438]|uniref:sensor histidine kinase n=1 Tax=Streptomyces sp. NPDC005438 TaxID=3156880 RepID=UPI0033B67A71